MRPKNIHFSKRLKVQFEDTFVHYIEKNQFVDSPEYDLSNRSILIDKEQRFQVSITAVEKSVLLTWTREKLSQYLNSNPNLSAIFDILIGKDISDKLYQIQEMLLSNPESPLGRKNGACANRIQSVCPSPNPSLINLRSALAANGSMSSQDHLNALGSDLNGWCSQLHTVLSLKQNTFESQV